jgi:hypothetical protein
MFDNELDVLTKTYTKEEVNKEKNDTTANTLKSSPKEEEKDYLKVSLSHLLLDLYKLYII